MFQITFPFKDNKVLSYLILSYLILSYLILSEKANSSSRKQLLSVYKRLRGREKTSPLPTVYPPRQLPDVFSDCFSPKVSAIRSVLDKQTPSSPVDCPDSSSSSALDSFCPWFILILSLTHSVLDSVFDSFWPWLILSLTLSLTHSVLDSVRYSFCPWLCPWLILSLTHSVLDSFCPWFTLSLTHSVLDSVLDSFCPWLILSLTLSLTHFVWCLSRNLRVWFWSPSPRPVRLIYSWIYSFGQTSSVLLSKTSGQSSNKAIFQESSGETNTRWPIPS